MAQIADLLDILARPERITAIIVDELTSIKSEFGDARRSKIELNATELNTEDLITPQEMVVTMSHAGYVKSQPLSEYSAQKRGGRGKQATAMKEDDWIDTLFIANTHDHILCFSNRGRVYWRQGLRSSAGFAELARPSDHQYVPASGRREDHGRVAGQGILGRQIRVHGHRVRNGKEDAAGSL